MSVSASTRTPAGSGASTGEAALTGAPVARRLYREIAADPETGLLLEVVGVGGAGKSVLLDVLARLYTESGVPVLRSVPAAGDPGLAVLGDAAVPGDAAVLVDDAHLLDAPTLDGLAGAVRSGGVRRLVLARRPWPRPAALTALGALLAEVRAPVVLADLDRAGVAGRAALALGARPPMELVDAVLAQTGGSAALVGRLLGALADAGELTSGRVEPPPGLIEQLGYQSERLPEPVRRLALALAVGAPPDVEVLAPLLELPPSDVTDLAEQATAAGLLTDRGTLRPLAARVVLAHTPPVRRLAERGRLAHVQLDRGGSVLAAAVDLLGTGASGARMASVFGTAADEALRDGARPELAGRLLDAAVAAGAPAIELAARGAEAAARAGDLDRALELADQVLADPAAVSDADRARAVSVAATALAQRGMLARSAELYRWLGAESMGANAVVAVPALLGTGALEEARALLEPPAGTRRAPTLLAGAESLLARGVYDTVAGSPTAALSQLARAAALLEPTAAAVLLPDTPAALAALVAAHSGELDVASSVLDRAVAVGLGGPSSAARHRLLQAWILMSRGATVAARGLLAEVDATAGATGRVLEPRDELVAAALEVGLARRAGDLAALMPAWGRAREAIVRHPVDLYVLAPLGELTVAAARLREQAWVRPHLDEAHALLARLGNPVLWSTSLHWSELHAALTAERWDEAAQHAAALADAAARDTGNRRYAAAMAVAADCWLAVLRGEVDPASVEAAARGLHAVGLSWEGGKLAGQAAIRTTDRKAMSALLGCARGLQSSGPAGSSEPPASQPPGPPSPSAQQPARPRPRSEAGERVADSTGNLSEREREVAELVLIGLTYKQVGERLFISAKTVEHHVARMRQRLGSNSRGELIAHLRMIIKDG